MPQKLIAIYYSLYYFPLYGDIINQYGKHGRYFPCFAENILLYARQDGIAGLTRQAGQPGNSIPTSAAGLRKFSRYNVDIRQNFPYITKSSLFNN